MKPEGKIGFFDARTQKREKFRKWANRKGESNVWGVYGSHIESYQSDFADVLEGIDLVEFIKRHTNPVILDLMAPSDTIVSLCKEAKIKPTYGLAVSLEDNRPIIKRVVQRHNHIYQIGSDLSDFGTWKVIADKLHGRKADLIMERGGLGVAYIPPDRHFYNAAMKQLWDILSDENGLLLAETHGTRLLSQIGISVEQWIAQIKTLGVPAAYAQSEYDIDDWGYSGYIKLMKTAQAPSRLPLF